MEIVWAVECEEKEISNFVASKACKKIYAFKPNDGTQSLRKHNCSENRGLRVYPYPRVYPTLPLVGLLRVVRVTGIPAGRVGSGRKFDLRARVGSGNNLLATGRVG